MSPRACARAPCSCPSTSGSRRPTCSPTPPATPWPRSPSSRCAPAGSPPERLPRPRSALIPLYDDVPTRRFAAVTLVVILLNVAVFAFELTLPRYGMTLGGFYAKAGATPFELAHGLDVPPRSEEHTSELQSRF